jgi:hypothetical protein
MGMAIAIGSIVVLIGWAMMVFAWRQTYQNRIQTTAQITAFNAVQMIEEDVMRSSQIEIPDPDYPSVPSIQLRVPSGNTTIRRAYRLVSGNLIAHFKDETAGSYTAFSGISAMTFAFANSPTNTIARTTCSVVAGGATITVASTAFRRN